MSLLNVPITLLEDDPRIKKLLVDFFDKFELHAEDNNYQTWRVSKAEFGLIYSNDDAVVVSIRTIPTSVVANGPSYEICPLEITAINGITLLPRNYACHKPIDRTISKG